MAEILLTVDDHITTVYSNSNFIREFQTAVDGLQGLQRPILKILKILKIILNSSRSFPDISNSRDRGEKK